MNLRSSWVAETGQTRENTRLNQVGATTPVNPVQVRSGILPGSYDGRYRLSGFWMFGSAAMSATVSEGRALIQGEISQGVYPVALPAAETITFAAGDAQYGRVDLVVAKVYDNLYDSSGRNEAKIEIIQGVPGPTPQAPAIPPRSLALYEVTVVAGASAGNGGINWNTSLKDLRIPVVSLGGILPVEGAVFPGAYPGQYQDSGGALQRWDGGAWVPYPSALGGIIPNSASTLPATYTGQYRDSTGGQLQRWNGSAWVPAVPGPFFTGSNDSGWTQSTTYTAALTDTTSTPLDVDFVAGPSGAALITYGARMHAESATPTTVAMSFRLTKGTAPAMEPNDEMAVLCTGSAPASMSSTTRVYGMTPGAAYTLTAMFKVGNSAVKGHFDNTFLRVDNQA